MTRWKREAMRAVKRAARVGADAADVVVRLRGRPGVLGVVSVVSRLANTYFETSAVDSSEFFRAWSYFEIGVLSKPLLEAARAGGSLETVADTKDGSIAVADLGGVSFGWKTRDWGIDGPWTFGGTREQYAEACSRLLWSSHEGRIVLRQHGGLGGEVELRSDPISEAHTSPTAESVLAGVRAFSGVGLGRSILLYGEPGTGKSSMMRWVAREVGGRTLRVRASDLSSVADLADVVGRLDPDAVLLDDIDRAEKPAAVLDVVESVRARAGLIMATANDLGRMDRASIRPGRFDALIEVSSLDTEVIDAMLSGRPGGDAVRDLPVAYIAEFCRIADALGDDAAAAAVRELRERVERVGAKAKEDR